MLTVCLTSHLARNGSGPEGEINKWRRRSRRAVPSDVAVPAVGCRISAKRKACCGRHNLHLPRSPALVRHCRDHGGQEHDASRRSVSRSRETAFEDAVNAGWGNAPGVRLRLPRERVRRVICLSWSKQR
ncbi:unnamed protein product [Ixodes persulcatus]